MPDEEGIQPVYSFGVITFGARGENPPELNAQRLHGLKVASRGPGIRELLVDQEGAQSIEAGNAVRVVAPGSFLFTFRGRVGKTHGEFGVRGQIHSCSYPAGLPRYGAICVTGYYWSRRGARCLVKQGPHVTPVWRPRHARVSCVLRRVPRTPCPDRRGRPTRAVTGDTRRDVAQ